MLYNKKISLIIPCKNEEKALYVMLKKVPTYIDEIIIIDNCSTDNTTSIAKLGGAKVFYENRHVGGVGYGYAHQTGMKEAQGDIIIAMDGDNTYPIESIEKIITYMEESKSDFVSCARFPLSNQHAISSIRKLGIKILNMEIFLLYGYQIKDILSGMWAMKKECVNKLKTENGEWNFSPEIKLAAILHPYIRFSEYHINHNVRLNGKSKQKLFKTGFSHLLYILKKRLEIYNTQSSQKAHILFEHLRSSLKNMTTSILLKPRS